MTSSTEAGSTAVTEPKYPHVHVRLIGEDGNAGAIMGRVAEAMRAAGVPSEERNAYRLESMQGDYTQLLRTVFKWVTVVGSDMLD